ncbi:MAG: cation:proton antiporter [Bacilli bacterium]|nr:cation:proton antiporter [Bacilli bacterium]MDD4303724.1 cation:proton antiporter [Bacilli bacterium]
MEYLNITLILGLAMAAGLLSTRLMKLLNLPNVTGYLIIGLLLGPFVGHLFSEQAISDFSILSDIALGFIAFSIGCEFKLSSLKKIGGKVVIITLFQALLTAVVVALAVFAFSRDVALSLTLGAIATATAPAATLMVVRQYKAKGPVVDTLLPVVAFDDAIGLIVFSVLLSISKVVATNSSLTAEAILLAPLVEIFLSLAIGAALGALLALVMRFFKSRANRLTLMITTVFLGVGLTKLFAFIDWYSLSSLLLCMMIGAVFANMRSDSNLVVEGVDRWTPPLFMFFFILSGAELDVRVIVTVGLIGVVYIVARSVGKYFGAYLGALSTKSDKNIRHYLGFTLLPQAGVAIGMAKVVSEEMPSDIGVKIVTVVLCSVLFFELVGPIITKLALMRAGEIIKEPKKPKKITPPPAS